MQRRNTIGCQWDEKTSGVCDRTTSSDLPSITVNINSHEMLPLDALEGFDLPEHHKAPGGPAVDHLKSEGAAGEQVSFSTTTTARTESDEEHRFLQPPTRRRRQRSYDQLDSTGLSAIYESEDDCSTSSFSTAGISSSDVSSTSEGEDDGAGAYVSLREGRAYRKRRYIVREILQTERAYVDHLRDMVEGFYLPLEQAFTSPAESEVLRRVRSGGHHRQGDLPTREDVREVFTNIVTIYELNSKFLDSLEEMQVHLDSANDYDLQLGDAFLAVTDSFKFYSSYVNKYQASMDALERMKETLIWKELAKEVALKRCMQFTSLVITPVQRIPRYLLLLRDLLNNTPPSHPDFVKLSLVLPRMEEVATYINNEKSKFDNITVILNLSYLISGYEDSFLKPGRKFIKEGFMKIYDAEGVKLKRRYFFLFSDILLMTRPKRGSTITFFNKGNGRYQFVDSLNMLFATVERTADGPGTALSVTDGVCALTSSCSPEISLACSAATLSNGIEVRQANGVRYVLHCADREETDSWYEAFQDAIAGVRLACSINKTRSNALSSHITEVVREVHASEPETVGTVAVADAKAGKSGRRLFGIRSSSLDHSGLSSRRKRSGSDTGPRHLPHNSSSSSSSSPSPLSISSPTSPSSCSPLTSPTSGGSPSSSSPAPAFGSGVATAFIIQSASSALTRLSSMKKKKSRDSNKTTASLVSVKEEDEAQLPAVAPAGSSAGEIKCRLRKSSRTRSSRSLRATWGGTEVVSDDQPT